MKNSALRTSSSLDEGECLRFYTLTVTAARQPYHHNEYELIVLPDAAAITLKVGEETFSLRGAQLILTAPGLTHGWTVPAPPDAAPANGLSIRWSADLLGDRFLGKTHMQSIGQLLEKARFGLCFPSELIPDVRCQLQTLEQKKGFAIVLGLLALLHRLSEAAALPLLKEPATARRETTVAESRISSAVAFMRSNYSHPITLGDVAKKAHMTKGAFCRSIRKNTGKTFAESLIEIRIGHVCRMLLDTSANVSEIAYRTGYQNIHHFHRSFRRLKGCTPKEYREQHTTAGSAE
jgi:AraC-like DNA-binding protein